MNLPLTLTVQSLAKAMLAKPGLKSVFHLMISVILGQLEKATRVPMDLVILIDRSGSTAKIMETGKSILETAKDAAWNAICSLSPDDRFAVVQFDSVCGYQDVVLGFTNADENGKAAAGNALFRIYSSGGTNYGAGLRQAQSMFNAGGTRKQVLVFFTDGANAGGEKPAPICQELRDAGVAVFVGGLNVDNNGELLLESMAGQNFKSLATVDEVSNFFTDAQTQSAQAVITNARLRISPVTFAQVNSFELVTRQGQPNYVPATSDRREVLISDIAVGDHLQSYLGLQVVLPEDIKPARRSFGKVELIGDVPSEGITGQVLAQAHIAVLFTDAPTPDMNAEVKDMINLAATARELYAAGQSNNSGDIQKHLDNARKTVAHSSADAARILAEKLKEIEAQVAANDPGAAAKSARRATKGFSPADAAAALRNLQKK